MTDAWDPNISPQARRLIDSEQLLHQLQQQMAEEASVRLPEDQGCIEPTDLW